MHKCAQAAAKLMRICEILYNEFTGKYNISVGRHVMIWWWYMLHIYVLSPIFSFDGS